MKKAIVALGLILAPYCCAGQTNDNVGLAIPSNATEFFIEERALEDPPHGFFNVFNSRTSYHSQNRFSALWHLDLLRRESEDTPFWDSAASNLKSVLRKSGRESLREYFLISGNVPVLENLKDRVDTWSSGDHAGKLVNFFARTLSGEEERDQISSPFHTEEGVPLKDYGSFRHKVSFGLRPFDFNSPYIFLGHSLRVDDERIFTVQGRFYFKEWQRPTGECILEVPLREYSLGGGLRIESEDWWYHKKKEDKEHIFSFLGIQGPFPIIGGEFFVGTGFPETLTAYYSRRF